jgi:hypothetical protein
MEVENPEIPVRPVINAIGVTTPPEKIAPASYGTSLFLSEDAFATSFEEASFLKELNRESSEKAPLEC